MKSKSNEITRVGAIASECCNGNIHVVVPKSWNKKRIFCFLKSEWDEMWRQQQRNNMTGKLVSSIIDGASVSKETVGGEMKWNKS